MPRAYHDRQAQKQGLNEAEFKTHLCSRLDALFNCTTGVKIDVRKYAWGGHGSDRAVRKRQLAAASR